MYKTFCMPVKKLFFSAVTIVAVASAITAFKAPVTKSSQKNEIKQQTSFRDLNKNGKRDVYEDPSQPIEARINDLLKKMTIEEIHLEIVPHHSVTSQSNQIL